MANPWIPPEQRTSFGGAGIDPKGIPAHEPGAKLDAGKIEMDLIIQGFPYALLEIGKVATYGHGKYSRHGWRSVPEAESRYLGAMLRHLLAHHSGEAMDAESGLAHLAQVAWNAMAILELSKKGLR